MPHVFDPQRRPLLALAGLEPYTVGNRPPDRKAMRAWLLRLARTTKEGVYSLDGDAVPVYFQSLRLRTVATAHILPNIALVSVSGVEKK